MKAAPDFTTPSFVDDCVSRCISEAVKVYEVDIADRSDHCESERACSISKCESPLEEAFLRCWCAITMVYNDWPMSLAQQVEIDGYRVDFVINSTVPGFTPIVVELDGHEFHEKTKQQVTKRNARDRALQQRGYKVMHVSGSEFFRDPYECVGGLRDHAQEIALDAAAAEFRRGRVWRRA